MTGNIIVSTCCLGDAPSDSEAFTAISPSQTCANYYLLLFCVFLSVSIPMNFIATLGNGVPMF